MKWYEDPLYIKMCERAEDIQKSWKTEAFDIYQSKEGIIRVVAEDYGCEFATEGISNYDWEKEVIWLPRQDQLQNMVKSRFIDYIHDAKFDSTASLLSAFYKFCNEKYDDCFSFEIAWFEFVMAELYSKYWVDKDWIKK